VKVPESVGYLPTLLAAAVELVVWFHLGDRGVEHARDGVDVQQTPRTDGAMRNTYRAAESPVDSLVEPELVHPQRRRQVVRGDVPLLVLAESHVDVVEAREGELADLLVESRPGTSYSAAGG
jgi:hypothetical protein